jgi:hypothetical protein
MKGAIVLIKRGTCDFGVKVALAGANGAAAALIYNDADGAIGGSTLWEPSRPEIGPYVPTAAITGRDGTALVAAVAKGKVTGRVIVVQKNVQQYSTNVIATTKGGDKNNVIMAGGHTDSTPDGPVGYSTPAMTFTDSHRESMTTVRARWVSSRLLSSCQSGRLRTLFPSDSGLLRSLEWLVPTTIWRP